MTGEKKNIQGNCHQAMSSFINRNSTSQKGMVPYNYFPGGLDGKVSAYNVRDRGSIPGLRRSPGEGNGNPLQYSCLENPMDGGAW